LLNYFSCLCHLFTFDQDIKFNIETADFRNKFHHQLPVSIEIGISSLISRNKDENGVVSYGLGGIRPLSLNKIIPLLIEQHSASLLCFNNCRELIEEQINQIFIHNKVNAADAKSSAAD
jgi:hypothetical protein